MHLYPNMAFILFKWYFYCDLDGAAAKRAI